MPFARSRQALLAAALCLATGAHAATLLDEGFADVDALAAADWRLVNANPDPALTIDWYQGMPEVFAAHGGADDSYIASSWGAAASGTTLENWLVTPTFSTAQAGTVTFWLRGGADPGYVDTVRFGFGDGSGDLASFVLGDVVTATDGWTQYRVTFAAGAAGSTARFAIEHTGLEDLSDYVGIDDLRIETQPTTAVPEPTGALLMAAGLFSLFALRRR